MTRYRCLLLAFLLTPLVGRAQSFRFRAAVDKVPQSGFYRILLPPDVVGRLNDNLTDVRIFDDRQREVPYQLIRQRPTRQTPFIEYELVSKKMQPGVATTLIIRNPAQNRINTLGLVITNTSVGKKASLSGSPDAQTWYAIDDAIWLAPTLTRETTTETKLLSFPPTDYAYYRLTINDSLTGPLNIQRVGHYAPVVSAGAYTTVPGLRWSQRDSSDKHTYIHLTRTPAARLDKLVFGVQSATPYHRQAELREFISRPKRRGRASGRYGSVYSFSLSSADSNGVFLPGLRVSDGYVVVANNDNPPLTIREVRAYQLTTYLLANLTAGQSYQLFFPATDLPAPAYDPTPFRPGLAVSSPIVRLGAITDSRKETARIFPAGNQLIWLMLTGVLVLLGFFSYRMLREMKQGD